MNRNRLLIILAAVLVLVSIAAGYYYLDSKQSSLETLESSNSLTIKEINGLRGIVDEEIDVVPTYASIQHLFQDKFIWNDIVDDLERIEVDLEIETFKQYTPVEKSEYPIYSGLDESMSIYKITIVFGGDLFIIQDYVSALQELEDITIIDKLTLTAPQGQEELGFYATTVELLYFINAEEIETT